MLDRKQIEEIRKDFPYLDIVNNNVYFDNAATAQTPRPVMDAVFKYYKHEHGNPNRGSHYFAEKSTIVHEEARTRVAEFIGAKSEEVVFTRNATESLNLIAYAWGLNNLKEGDEILISIMEHHANLVTWQYVAQQTGAKLSYLYIDENKQITEEEFAGKISPKTKVLGITAASNALGTLPNVKAMIAKAREVSPGIVCVVDGAQYAPHFKTDVKDLDCDFYVLSGHKMLAYMGIGILYGRAEILASMPPFLYGGEMIEYVTEQKSSYLDGPRKFEAGTVDVGGAKSLHRAIDYVEDIGIDSIIEYEKALTDYAHWKMRDLGYLDIYSPEGTKAPLVNFNFPEIHPHDVSTILYSKGVAIRSGHHCTQPLHRFLGVNSTCRASFAFYNTFEEIDYFIDQLDEVRKVMGFGS